MRQHLLRVTRDAAAFETLIHAVREAGERVGWLQLAPPSSAPKELAEAAARGVLRAVAVGGGRSVAVKPLRGAPVLRDLLREHFRGSILVLVKGEIDPAEPVTPPKLEPHGDDWLVELDDEPSRTLTTRRLIAALQRPHPWQRPESGAPSSGQRRKKRQ